MNQTSSILKPAFGALRPATPITSGGVTLLPFTTTYQGGKRYVLLDQAIARGRLTITEVSDGGSVPYLKAVNKGPWPVLIFDGEELVGAKQNRIANTTILIGVGESILPVSCVEQGRWTLRSRTFAAGAYASHPGLRHTNQLRVGESLKEAGRGQRVEGLSQVERARRYRADQGVVWHEVRSRSHQAGVWSTTDAMADAYEARAADLESTSQAFLGRLGAGAVGGGGGVPVEGMVAAAVFIGSRFVCFDAVWPAKRFAQLYPKLLRGYAFEALDPSDAEMAPPTDPEAEMLRIFADLAEAHPDVLPGVDLGRDIRVEAKAAFGAGLAWEDSLVQLSLFPR